MSKTTDAYTETGAFNFQMREETLTSVDLVTFRIVPLCRLRYQQKKVKSDTIIGGSKHQRRRGGGGVGGVGWVTP